MTGPERVDGETSHSFTQVGRDFRGPTLTVQVANLV